MSDPTPTPPLHGEDLLTAVSEAMVALHERYHGRAPASTETRLLDDELLAVVMAGVYTDVEKTMIELQRGPNVQETRSAFQEAMQERFIGEVERLSGRGVLAFISIRASAPTSKSSCSSSTSSPEHRMKARTDRYFGTVDSVASPTPLARGLPG